MMDDLIEALQIFQKINKNAQTNCSHDCLAVYGVDECNLDRADVKRLEELGFYPGDGFSDDEPDAFHSYRFGSC